MSNVVQLKVTLDNFEPVVWRRVLVPETVALPKLHRIIQELMLWWNYHLHVFEIDGVTFGQPEFDEDDDFNWKNERGVKIIKLVSVGESFNYRYDFGDNWSLAIEVEKLWPVRTALKHAVCVAGEFCAPPEDVGGIGGFREFLDAISNPHHDSHDGLVEWSGGHYDFTRFDIAEVNARLQQMS